MSVARGAAALITTQPLTWGATLLTAALVPQYLGAESLGRYSMVYTVANLAGIVTSLGIPNHLRRSIAAEPHRAAQAAGGALVSVVGLAVGAALLLGVALPLLGFEADAPEIVRLALVVMVITGAQSVIFSQLIGREHHQAFAWLNAGGKIGSAVAGIAALAAGAGLVGFVAAWIATVGLTVVVGARMAGLRVDRTCLDRMLLRGLVLGGLPFLGWNLAITVRNQIDVVLVGLLLNEHAAGWLAAAYRIVDIPVFIPTLIVTPLLPALTRSVGDPEVFRRTLSRSLTAVLFLTVPVSALLVALAPSIPSVLHWGAEFERSVPLMMVIACEEPLSAINMVLSTALFAARRERRWLMVGVFAALFNPCLNLFAIPAAEAWTGNGALGAALIEITTELLMFIGAALLVPRAMLTATTLKMSVRIILAGVCLGLTTNALREVSLALAVVVGCCAYVAAALVLGVFQVRDAWAARSHAWQALSGRGIASAA